VNIAKYATSAALFAIAVTSPVTSFAKDTTAKKEEPASLGKAAAAKPTFNTGVARARDPLDTAISTSTILEADISKIGPTSLAELVRLVPGIRSEAGTGETGGNYSVRGLPLVEEGAKYIQLQENGLPVLEFGDITHATPDSFMRIDLNLAAVQVIRGGSASTFASNAPGGIINLIEKTGDVEGGSIQATAGVNYDLYRVDMEYGAPINASTRFHIGGFFRSGEGPRRTGFTSYRGGQVKFNVTKEFAGGYVRLYAKFLDDRVPYYAYIPAKVTGTNDNPVYSNIPGFSVTRDSLLSRYITTLPVLDSSNRLDRVDTQRGTHFKSNSIGFETKFDVGEWTINDSFRYAKMKGTSTPAAQMVGLPAAFMANIFGGTGFRYVNGPNAGQTVAPSDPVQVGLIWYENLRDLSNFTNDLRTSRVWNAGKGQITVTAGFYHSSQEIRFDNYWNNHFRNAIGGGNSTLLDLYAGTTPITQNGVLALGLFGYPYTKRTWDVNYSVSAPYGSVNYRVGRLAVGGSLRYDIGRARGRVQQDNPLTQGTYDLSGDGIPDVVAAYSPTTPPNPIHYNYHYLSYSVSANYRVAESFSLFARYSRGARAGADRLLFTPALNPVTGGLTDQAKPYTPVRQLEGGFKFRTSNLTFNTTGFLANVSETNDQINTDSSGRPQRELLSRDYRAYGAEFEGSWRQGAFTLNAGATLTHARIVKDSKRPETEGNTPRNQAALIYQIRPQYDRGIFSAGASIIGTTKSYTQDVNKLRLPAYTTVGLFAQIRPTRQTVLSITASNVFDRKAFTSILEGSLPASGYVSSSVLTGRIISTALRFNF
jgi:outer membrane receptor protein involved in Fe transport